MARVVVVTPNPAIDVTYDVADQTPGESHRVSSVERRPGGKGINVARALLALGHDPVNVLPLGGGSGDWVRAALADLGLAASVTPIAGFGVTTTTRAIRPSASLVAPCRLRRRAGRPGCRRRAARRGPGRGRGCRS